MTEQKARTWRQSEPGEQQSAETLWIENYGRTFPIDALPAAARDAAATVADVHSVPVQMPAMCALATLSGAMGRTWAFTGAARDGQETHGNLYVGVAAPIGTGKATAAILARPLVEFSAHRAKLFREFTQPLLLAEIGRLEAQLKGIRARFQNPKARERSGRSAAEDENEQVELEKNLARAKRELPAPRMLVEDFTSQKLIEICGRNPDGAAFVYSTEGAEVFRILGGRYRGDGKGDCEIWLKGFSCEPIQQDRMGRSVDAHPCLVALLLVQPSVMREVYGNREFLERGFCARLLPVICDIEPQLDEGDEGQLDKGALERWGRLINEVCERRPANPGAVPVAMHFDSRARDTFRDFHNETVELRRQVPDIQEQLGRARELAIRLGAVLAVADDPDMPLGIIGADVAERAIQIARWCVGQQLAILHSGRADRQLERLERLCRLIDKAGGAITLRDAAKSHSYPEGEIRTLCAAFPAVLVTEQRQHLHGGRPSEIVMKAP